MADLLNNQPFCSNNLMLSSQCNALLHEISLFKYTVQRSNMEVLFMPFICDKRGKSLNGWMAAVVIMILYFLV